MDFSPILAAADAAKQPLITFDVNLFWKHVTSLGMRESLTLIAFGSVCVFYGMQIHKILVAICAGFIGLLIGVELGKRGGSEVWGGVIGCVSLVVAAIPLVKWGVSVLAAIAGGVITGGIWHACGLPQQYLWAGALVGAVAGGMISFIVFNIAVSLFTCLAGTAMVMTGVLALLHLYEPTSKGIAEIVLTHAWFVPLALIVPTFGFMFLQNKMGSGGGGGE